MYSSMNQHVGATSATQLHSSESCKTPAAISGCGLDWSRFFTPELVSMMSCQITMHLQGVHPSGRPVVVPDHAILGMLDSQAQSYRPPAYSPGVMIPNSRPYGLQEIVNRTISAIVNEVSYEYGMEAARNTWDVRNQLLGDFNPHGLQAHSGIKIRENTATTSEFQMRY